MLSHYHENTASFNASSIANLSLSCIPKTESHSLYSGEKDELHLRKNIGCNSTKTDKAWETYTGNFILDNPHGEGSYKWKTDEGDISYEGYIFCNHIQGYGLFSYPDGSTHEGLYKNNCRFGPGVYTEPSGKQSVGIWNKQKLIRLAVKLETGVPTMVCTSQGKTKMLRYRKLLPVDKSSHDKARHILKEMDAPPRVLKISECLYNMYGKDNRSPTFNWPLYNKTFYPVRVEKKVTARIETPSKSDHLSKTDKSEGKSLKKKLKQGALKDEMKDLLVEAFDERERKKSSLQALLNNATHLMAWNNTPIMEEILMHCFKHYNQEDLITYDIADVLQNNRKCFRAPGTHETLCVRFLRRCYEGDHWRVDDYLAFKSVDPNLSDCYGNTGLLTAAANDHLSVIDVVLNRGGNINMCNNEGLTPLALCMTRYHALVNGIKDWEKAFLGSPEKPTGTENLLKWRLPEDEMEDQNALDDETSKTTTITATVEEEGEAEGKELFAHQSIHKIAAVKSTILKLLNRGADPLQSNVPMTILIMAVKSQDEDIIGQLLQAGADPNERGPTEDGALSPLYLAVMLPTGDTMVNICRLLLKRGADPNIGLQATEEDEEKFKFGDLDNDEVGTKTVLHALATRDDGVYYDEHLSTVLDMLIAHRANTNALFLGHTPLSAAIVKGNIHMIQSLLSSDKVDPNQQLGRNLGVPLTVLLNAKCAPNLPIEDAAEIVNTLVDKGANLLDTVRVGDYRGSIIEYAHQQYEQFKNRFITGKDKADKNKDQEYKGLLEYTTKLAQELVIKNIKDLLKHGVIPKRSTLVRTKSVTGRSKGSIRRSGRVSRRGRTSRTSRLSEGKPQQIIPEWLSPEDVVYVLNRVQDQDKIPVQPEQAEALLRLAMPSEKMHDEEFLKKLLTQVKGMPGYVDPVLQIVPKKQQRSVAPWSVSSPGMKTTLTAGSRMLSRIMSTASGRENKLFGVCFGCERIFRHELLTLCPECKQVKFCSEECFLKARNNKTHACKTNMNFNWEDHLKVGSTPDRRTVSTRRSDRDAGSRETSPEDGSYAKDRSKMERKWDERSSAWDIEKDVYHKEEYERRSLQIRRGERERRGRQSREISGKKRSVEGDSLDYYRAGDSKKRDIDKEYIQESGMKGGLNKWDIVKKYIGTKEMEDEARLRDSSQRYGTESYKEDGLRKRSIDKGYIGEKDREDYSKMKDTDKRYSRKYYREDDSKKRGSSRRYSTESYRDGLKRRSIDKGYIGEKDREYGSKMRDTMKRYSRKSYRGDDSKKRGSSRRYSTESYRDGLKKRGSSQRYSRSYMENGRRRAMAGRRQWQEEGKSYMDNDRKKYGQDDSTDRDIGMEYIHGKYTEHGTRRRGSKRRDSQEIEDDFTKRGSYRGRRQHKKFSKEKSKTKSKKREIKMGYSIETYRVGGSKTWDINKGFTRENFGEISPRHIPESNTENRKGKPAKRNINLGYSIETYRVGGSKKWDINKGFVPEADEKEDESVNSEMRRSKERYKEDGSKPTASKKGFVTAHRREKDSRKSGIAERLSAERKDGPMRRDISKEGGGDFNNKDGAQNARRGKTHMGQGDTADGRIVAGRKSTRQRPHSKHIDGGASERGGPKKTSTWHSLDTDRSGHDRRSDEDGRGIHDPRVSHIVQNDGDLYYIMNGQTSLRKENYAFT